MPPSAWDSVSDRYDRQRWLERSSLSLLLDLAAPAPADRVLDVATGTGAVLDTLAGRVRRPRVVVGIDRSARMLGHVGALPAGWRVEQADARAMPFADGAFDLVTASYLLHVLGEADRAAVLAEIHRVLAPGGRLAVLTPVIPPHRGLHAVARALDWLANAAPDRFGGLRALDSRAELNASGFVIREARFSLRGYLALCVLATKP